MDPENVVLFNRLDRILYNFRNPVRNGATAGTLGFRRMDEQDYVLTCNTLRKNGMLNELKKKYRSM